MKKITLFLIIIFVAQSIFAITNNENNNTNLLVIEVTNTADSGTGTLRQAVLNAVNGDEITFSSSLDGTPIVLQSHIETTKSIKITGNGSEKTIIDGGGNGRVFNFTSSNSSISMSGLTIRNGAIRYDGSSGGGIWTTGNLTLTNCAIRGNKAITSGLVNNAKTAGGGITSQVGTLIMKNCLVAGNFAVFEGGGIYKPSGDLTLINTTVVNNLTSFYTSDGSPGTLESAGGISFSSGPGYTFTLQNSIIWGNKSDTYIQVKGDIDISSNSIVQDMVLTGNGNLDGTDPANNPMFLIQDEIFYYNVPTLVGDYRMQPNSKLIDAGNNVFNSELTDIKGKTRIIDGNGDTVNTIDIGCIEFQGTEFITRWKTDNPGFTNDNQISIPAISFSGGFNYDIEWGDGTTDTGVYGEITHTYNEAGTYNVRITGNLPNLLFNGGRDAEKLISILNWGNIEWRSMSSAFKGCSNLVIEAADTPNLSNVEDCSEMFMGATSVNDNFENWDVSNVKKMIRMFKGATSFNNNISNWDVNNVEYFTGMFQDSNFNQNINTWTTSSAISLGGMFWGNTAFNKPLSNWNVSNVIEFMYMFEGATQFNQDIGNWNISSAKSIARMFKGATSFDQDLGNWDISSLDNYAYGTGISGATDMFEGVTLSTENYDKLLIGWNTLNTVTGETSIPSYIKFDGGNSKYCKGKSGRDNLETSRNWDITDGGMESSGINAICKNITVNLDATGNVTITPEDINNGSDDVCGTASLSISKTSFNCSNLGENTVTLTITDSEENKSSCNAIVTIVDDIPPNVICKNITISLDESGSITIKPEDIDNGSNDTCSGIASMSLSKSTFTCNNIGENTVTLTITDNNGNSNSCNAIIRVSGVEAAFTSNTTSVCKNTPINFTDTSTVYGEATISSWHWDFGDGNTSTDQNPTHIFETPKTFNVKLTTTDLSGCESTFSSSVVVYPPKALFTVSDDLIFLPQEVSFKDESISPDIWYWNFGDGNTSTIKNPSYNYTTPGVYDIKLTVQDTIYGCSDTYLKTIKVNKLTASIGGNSMYFGCGPFEVDFVNSSINEGPGTIDSYLWDFGDGNTSIEESPTHIYEKSGVYDVLLTVTNDLGNTSSDTKVNFVQVIGPEVDFKTADQTVGCPDLTIDFKDLTIFVAPIIQWTWDFGDGNTSNLQNPSHTYTEYGAYDVSLTIADIDGCSRTLTKEAFVDTSDKIPPTVFTKDIIVQLDALGNVNLNGSNIDNGSTDNCTIASRTVSPNIFTCSNIGENTVTLTVTDMAGNSSSADATIIVVDNTPPTAICKNITIQLDENGEAFISPKDLDNGSTDNCGISIFGFKINNRLNYLKEKLDCSNIGENEIELIVKDQSNNKSSCFATVTVEDTIAPTVITQNITVELNADGNATFTPEEINNGSYDNCEILGMFLTTENEDKFEYSFNCSNIGQNNVKLYVTDTNGNSASATAIVTVKDNLAPTVITQNITVELNADGNATFTPEEINNGSYDNCEIATLVLDKTSFNCSNIGENIVSLTVTDESGNSANATAIVTVKDNLAPTVLTQNITVELDATGTVEITPEQINNGSSDNCSIESMELDITTFDCSNVGENTITLTVTDVNGNSASASVIVNVEDNRDPTVITQNITVQLDATGTAIITAEQIDNGSSDNCSIESKELDITTFDCSTIGENTVSLTVTDVSGNRASATAIVTVEDNSAPTVITQNITVELGADGTANIIAADIDNGSTDNCATESYSLDITSFDCSSVGDNVVTLSTTDIHGNTASANAIVTVEDNIAPTAICMAAFSLELDETGSTTISIDDINNGSSDNCAVATIEIDKDSFNCSDIGENTVTLTVTDINGNSASCTTTITIEDTTNPLVITQNIYVELDSTGNATITAEDIDDGSFDTCGIASMSLDKTSFSCPTLDAHTVTLTVTDNAGNSTSEMALVTFTSDDLDNDLIADVCDDDMDGDGVDNSIDNCPDVSNSNQADLDRNGIGDVCDEGELEIPKGFSPNGDGTNDEFIIAGLHKYPNNSIQVYNRYGNIVYESNNYQNYWDGIGNKKETRLPAAPYFYVLSINGGSKIVKGWVYINY